MISDDEKVVKIAQFQKIARDDKKARARKEKEATAAANRVRFGRSGHEKKLARKLNEKSAKAHDALRLNSATQKPVDPAETED